MNNSKSESALGYGVFYSKVKKELNSVIPDYIKSVLVDLRDQPQAALWIEIGKALNSFPISEKVDKFRLMEVKELEDFRYANRVSDLVFDAELKTLEKEKEYVQVKKCIPNYFLAPRFAEAVEIIRILEKNLVAPAIEQLKSKPKKYEALRQELLLCLLYTID
jgi:hypothetical protein